MEKFKVGDKVYKPTGYKFISTIVSVFKTKKGHTRIVAENEDGLLHPADKVESASDIAAKDGDITAITAEACVGAECCGPGFVYENSTCIGGK